MHQGAPIEPGFGHSQRECNKIGRKRPLSHANQREELQEQEGQQAQRSCRFEARESRCYTHNTDTSATIKNHRI
jgi:hypothetical protein